MAAPRSAGWSWPRAPSWTGWPWTRPISARAWPSFPRTRAGATASSQLTWTSNIGFVYERASLEQVDSFGYPGEGWGLAYDAAGDRLAMSDGSATLRWLDPETFAERGRLEVRDGAAPVGMLNELEFAGGMLYANVLPTSRIARIDPATGRVEAWIDCRALRPPGIAPGAVLNGIAYDAAGERFFLTGKLWPTLYAVEFEPPADPR